MKGLVTAIWLLGGAILLLGCGSGGGGPVFPTSDPFGSEPSGASSEPSGTTNGEMPGNQGNIADLCARDCGRIMAACPSAATSNCVASCEADFSSYPQCQVPVEEYLNCIISVTVACTSNGSSDISPCEASAQALSSCINPPVSAAGPAT